MALHSLFQDFPEIQEKVTVLREVELKGEETVRCARMMKNIMCKLQKNDPAREFAVGYVMKYALEELNKGGRLQPVLIA